MQPQKNKSKNNGCGTAPGSGYFFHAIKPYSCLIDLINASKWISLQCLLKVLINQVHTERDLSN
jgi:hypothetical protein